MFQTAFLYWLIQRRQEFVRIHNAIRVKLIFDGMHQNKFGLRTHTGQPMFFDDAYAVFGGNRAVAGKDVFINNGIDGVFVLVGFVAQYVGQECIVMQAAVAQMSKADNLYAGKAGFQGRGALADKGGHLGDRDGDVVFDAGAEFALGSGNIFTQGP